MTIGSFQALAGQRALTIEDSPMSGCGTCRHTGVAPLDYILAVCLSKITASENELCLYSMCIAIMFQYSCVLFTFWQ